MFNPAAPIRNILATKKPLPRYLVALEMNGGPPDASATTKAPQISAKIPSVIRLTGRLTEANPNSRRSTASIEPTTRQIATTLTDSMNGNSKSFSRIFPARRCSRNRKLNTRTTASPDLRIGDPAPGEKDAAPEEDRNGSGKPAGNPPP